MTSTYSWLKERCQMQCMFLRDSNKNERRIVSIEHANFRTVRLSNIPQTYATIQTTLVPSVVLTCRSPAYTCRFEIAPLEWLKSGGVEVFNLLPRPDQGPAGRTHRSFFHLSVTMSSLFFPNFRRWSIAPELRSRDPIHHLNHDE